MKTIESKKTNKWASIVWLVIGGFILLMMASSCSSSKKLENTSSIKKGNVRSSSIGNFDVYPIAPYGDIVFHVEGEEIWAIQKVHTQTLNRQGKNDESIWDWNYALAAFSTSEKVFIASNIKTSRRFDKTKKGLRTLSDRDYKEHVEDFCLKDPIKLDKRTFLVFVGKDKKVYLIAKKGYDEIFDNGTKDLYAISKEEEAGIYVINFNVFPFREAGYQEKPSYSKREREFSPPERQATSSSSKIPEYHVVQRGENLSIIAKKYGMDWKTLKMFNGFSDKEASNLAIGQKIKLR